MHAYRYQLVRDGLFAVVLTLLAVVLICLLPGERLAQNRSGRIAIGRGGGLHGIAAPESTRMAIVKLYLTSSSTFFVGWSYVVFFRDMAAAWGQSAFALRHAFSEDLLAFASHPFGLYAEEDAQALVREADLTAFAGALGGVLFFGPVLSVAVLYAKHALIQRLRSSTAHTATHTPPPARDMLRLQRATVRARLARLGVLDPQQPAARADTLPRGLGWGRSVEGQVLDVVHGEALRRATTTGSLDTTAACAGTATNGDTNGEPLLTPQQATATLALTTAPPPTSAPSRVAVLDA